MRKQFFSLRTVSAVLVLALASLGFVGCSEESASNIPNNADGKGMNEIFNTSTINSFAEALDLDPNDYNALLVTSINTNGKRHGFDNPEVTITKPNAFFYDRTNKLFTSQSFVHCNAKAMVYQQNMYPERYIHGASWDDESYRHGEMISWDWRTHQMELVSASLRLPPDFEPMSLSSNKTMKVSDGVTLTWSNPQPGADVLINLYSMPESGATPRYISTDIFTPDDGSYTFTADDLRAFGVFEQGTLIFHIVRANMIEKSYENGTKTAAIMTIAEANYGVYVEP